MDFITAADPEVGQAIRAEYDRQQQNIELIASENIVSAAVLAAAGTVLTNKYAEGYPGKRYYGGCQCVDVVENIAIERAKKLFGANYANVQPHSGAQANFAVYQALCQHGDTVLGMSLDQGGHLTHGSPVNFSGKNYNMVAYGLGEDGRIDYDQVRDLARKHKPRMILAGASAYPRTIDFKTFADIAHEVGAYLFVDMAHIAGLVAAVDVATANNTVAIVMSGAIAKEISEEYHIDARRSASLLDIFASVMQGILPYGAQLLYASAGTGVAALEIVPYMFYCYLMAVCAIVFILFFSGREK